MTKIITYSQKLDASDSDGYYQTIATFADNWLNNVKAVIKDIAAGFWDYRRERGEIDRSDDECIFELLVLGVLIHEHGQEVIRLPVVVLRLLSWLKVWCGCPL